MKEKAYPKYDSVRSGNKVSWIYYTSKDKALEASEVAKHNAETDEREFSYWEKERMYSWGGHMGFMCLTDRGHWFNLDYLGRDAQIQGEQYEY
jgi:hypothetical protein